MQYTQLYSARLLLSILALTQILYPQYPQETLNKALFAAITSEKTDFVGRLVLNGAAIDSRDTEGRTPLIVAAQMLQPEIVEYLIACKADIRARDAAGLTAFDHIMYRNIVKRGDNTDVLHARVHRLLADAIIAQPRRISPTTVAQFH